MACLFYPTKVKNKRCYRSSKGEPKIIDMRKKSCIYVGLRKFKDTVRIQFLIHLLEFLIDILFLRDKMNVVREVGI